MLQYKITIPRLLGDPSLWDTFVAEMKKGAVAALPTDTLYGLAADAESPAGVRAIYEAKGRGEEKPLILFLPDADGLARLGIVPEPRVRRLLDRSWPGGVTAVFALPGHPLPAFTFPSLGVRVPNHPELLRLLHRYPGGLLTTSANRSGQPPLPDADSIIETFGPAVPCGLDGGRLEPSPPSTVADVSVWPPRILRQGKILLDLS
jgi:L-threonylcarbamoyladenylate synthase